MNSDWKKLLGFRNMQEKLEKFNTYFSTMRTDAWIFFIAWLSFPVGINKMLFDRWVIP